MTKGSPVQLDGRGRALLEQRSQHWKSTLGLNREPFLYREGRLFARDVTGFVDLGSIFVEIAPKFLSMPTTSDPLWRRALWAIMSRVYRVPGLFLNTPAQVTQTDTLPDLLGMILSRSLRDSKPNGRPMGYVSERGRLGHFQGRLDLVNALDLLMYPGQIPCEYDVYSENVTTNRLLRWSAEQLSRQVRAVQLGVELREEALSFDGVSSLPPSLAEADRITLPPHHAALQPAILVGQLLLLGRGMQHGYGEYELPGFLWKSYEVFERFVLYLIRIVVRTHFAEVRVARGRVHLSAPSPSSGRQLQTDPDVRLEKQQRTLGILDAKYKSMDLQPFEGDVYQVVTGAWLTESPVVALIYPSPEGSHRELMGWRLLGPSAPTHLWAIFVNLVAMGSRSGERVLLDQLRSDLQEILAD